MRDVRLWIAAAVMALVSGCAGAGNCAYNACAGEQPAGCISINGCGVERQATLDTGTVVRPAR